jgi:hypothetical protein
MHADRIKQTRTPAGFFWRLWRIIDEITEKIIGSFAVGSKRGPQFLETVYKNALARELRKTRFDV